MLRAFLKDSAVYAIPAFVSRGLSLILIPLYTRVLTPADYGSLDLLIAFASIVKLTIALEVSQGVARFYAAEPDPDRKVDYASSAFWFTTVCYSGFSILMLSFAPQLADLIMGRADLVSVFQVGIIYIYASGIFYLVQSQFRWEMRSRHYAVVSLMMAITTAIVSVFLVYILKWGLLGLLVGMVVGTMPAMMLGLWWLRKSFRLRFSMNHLMEMLRFSTPMVFSGVAIWVSLYIDRLLINHFLSVEDVGLYGIGYRIASIAGLVMVGFQGALTPLVYSNYKNPNTPKQLERIFRIFLVFALSIFLFITLFASIIIQFVTTPAYYGGSVVVIFLVPAVLLANMYIFAPGISIAKKTHLIVWINVVGGSLNVVFNLILIPRLGIPGAALATMLSNFTAFSTYMAIGQRFYPIPHDWLRLSGLTSVAALMAIFLPLMTVSDVVRAPFYLFSIIVFLSVSVVIGVIRKSELIAGMGLITERVRGR